MLKPEDYSVEDLQKKKEEAERKAAEAAENAEDGDEEEEEEVEPEDLGPDPEIAQEKFGELNSLYVQSCQAFENEDFDERK